MGEEEVGRAVQRHGGLARAGSALHEQDAGEGVADDPVLLALDGRDDVAHPSGTRTTERREQRTWPAERESPIDEAFLGGGADFVVGQ